MSFTRALVLSGFQMCLESYLLCAVYNSVLVQPNLQAPSLLSNSRYLFLFLNPRFFRPSFFFQSIKRFIIQPKICPKAAVSRRYLRLPASCHRAKNGRYSPRRYLLYTMRFHFPWRHHKSKFRYSCYSKTCRVGRKCDFIYISFADAHLCTFR